MNVDPGLASWLQLTLTPGLGAATVRRLLRQFGLPENVLAAPREQLASIAGPAAAALLHEARSDAVARARALGLDVFEGDLLEAHLPAGHFDLVYMGRRRLQTLSI